MRLLPPAWRTNETLVSENPQIESAASHSRILEQPLQVDLLLAVRTRLLLADDAPAAYAVLVEHVIARQPVAGLDDQRLGVVGGARLLLHVDVVAADGAHVLLQVSGGDALGLVILHRTADNGTRSMSMCDKLGGELEINGKCVVDLFWVRFLSLLFKCLKLFTSNHEQHFKLKANS